jgi:predicted enzyme related to lactoylglutathione lyase
MLVNVPGILICDSFAVTFDEEGDMTRNATFIWNELITTDQKRCGEFYSALLGWTRKELDMGPIGTYTLFQQNGKDVAGMMNPAMEFSRSRPPFWSAYIAVDDIDACVARVTDLGGQIIAEPEDIPDVGRACMLTDPGGASVCLMTPLSKAVLKPS